MEQNSYKDLDIYKDALEQFYLTRRISLLLPKFELYELGSQIRRATDSVVSNIVEGYGRRRYRADFVRFLICSHASNMEATCLIERLIELFPDLIKDPVSLLELNDRLGRKLYKFIQHVEQR